jgi:hypothetical protein
LTKQPTRTLPLQCHGCGALSQTAVPNEAGFFDVSRKAVRQYLGLEEEGEARAPADVDRIVQEALRSVDVEALEQQGINLKALLPERAPETRAPAADKTPICERCHKLIHHSSGTSIYHPSIDSLRDTVEESPYKINHVYHVLDAADFPMSLLPRLQNLLDVTQRTQNRRAKVKFQHGKRTEMSFIISRSDLLAPGKEQIDSLMPYITETLREALGRVGGRIRLGNVHCVSAKRGWWTKELKEEIWKRGGAGWMVGKANVGKSQLFEAVFPKGRMDWAAPKHEVSVKVFPKSRQSADPFSVLEQPDTATGPESSNAFVDNTFLPGTAPSPEENSLLPPPQPETNYPEMPVVSPLPGTTASPIRVPFGNGRGELIDLPGLNRSDLEFHVRESARHSLVMKWRVVPEQKVLKPGQSLLLGGFIRLTPRNVAPEEELVFLAYAFTPIEPHTTATEKAIIVQTQGHGGPKIKNIALPGTGDKIKHAGAFQVRYDVTKARTGPITRKEAVGLKVAQLPYRVLGIDILVEGCGWVEVVVQVRTRQLFPDLEDSWEPRLDLRPDAVNAEKKKKDERAPEPTWPVIDVYSPEGKFIGYRPPMNAWALNKPKKDTRSRPRRSMKAAKKTEKWVRRAGEGGEGVGRSSFE